MEEIIKIEDKVKKYCDEDKLNLDQEEIPSDFTFTDTGGMTSPFTPFTPKTNRSTSITAFSSFYNSLRNPDYDMRVDDDDYEEDDDDVGYENELERIWVNVFQKGGESFEKLDIEMDDLGMVRKKDFGEIDREKCKEDIAKLQLRVELRKKRKFKAVHPKLSFMKKFLPTVVNVLLTKVKKRVHFKYFLHHPDHFFKTLAFHMFLRLQIFVSVVFQFPFNVPTLFRAIFYFLKILVGLDISSYFNPNLSQFVSAHTWLCYENDYVYQVIVGGFWVLFPIVVLLLWFLSMYKTNNTAEKILWVCIQIIYYPMLIHLGPYLSCGTYGDVYMGYCSLNYLFLGCFVILGLGFPIIMFVDLQKRIQFRSQKGHIDHLRFLETEKLLRYSNAYKHLRIYKISSLRYARFGVYFKVIFEVYLIKLLFVAGWMGFGFNHPNYMNGFVFCVLVVMWILELLIRPYRVFIHFILNLVCLGTISVVTAFIWIKLVDLQNPFFVDSALSITLLFFTLLGFAFIFGVVIMSMFTIEKNWPIEVKRIRRVEKILLHNIEVGHFLYHYSLNISPFFVNWKLLKYQVVVLKRKYQQISRVEFHPLRISVENLLVKLQSRIYELEKISLLPNKKFEKSIPQLKECLLKRDLDTIYILPKKRRVLLKVLVLKSLIKRIKTMVALPNPPQLYQRLERTENQDKVDLSFDRNKYAIKLIVGTEKGLQ